MTFASLKEHAGLASVALIIAWSGTQLKTMNESLGKISEELVAIRKGQEFTTFRLDQQLARIVRLEDKNADQDIRITRVEAKTK